MASRSVSSPLQRLVQRFYRPVVLVSASANAEAVCSLNNLRTAELLKPFGETLSQVKGLSFIFFGRARN